MIRVPIWKKGKKIHTMSFSVVELTARDTHQDQKCNLVQATQSNGGKIHGCSFWLKDSQVLPCGLCEGADKNALTPPLAFASARPNCWLQEKTLGHTEFGLTPHVLECIYLSRTFNESGDSTPDASAQNYVPCSVMGLLGNMQQRHLACLWKGLEFTRAPCVAAGFASLMKSNQLSPTQLNILASRTTKVGSRFPGLRSSKILIS